ncbi:hypothetical protein BKA82DRAFT_272426 [Pisolithus tinctorius]|uniref:Uncharacterized protein n=1 Tax=Pisolithus tinctorius Marx 270 TaxID=870435 RepID=A0A0C3PMI3_PISTI|nr:hypothetical protein BKA82DRAFT_272426 [Pisolithus tinctorius]KIO09569.1 hypothetical protein M404DRAFT_272426 [Pisolithus tinctorius Marx 270]
MVRSSAPNLRSTRSLIMPRRDNRTRYRVRSSFQCQMSSGKLGLERALRIISSYPDFSLYLVLVPSLRTVRVLGRGKKSYSYGSFVFFLSLQTYGSPRR